MGNFLAYVIVR